MVEIKEGQLWQEADKRYKRIIRVLAVNGDEITIITESDSYKASRKYSPTKASRKRFEGRPVSSHCGYFLVKES